MKKTILRCMGMALCLLPVLFAGCGDKEKEKEQGGSGGNDLSYTYEETAFGMSMKMVAVTGGTFRMGATSEQDGEGAGDDEYPVHSVTLSGFYIGKYEVTQVQWAAVMGTTISQQRDMIDIPKPLRPLVGVGDDYPMYYVSWEEAQAFCEKLSQKTGMTYRLPTEAEWEYAARGGQATDGTKYAGSNMVGKVAWYYENSYKLGESHPDYGTHPVGQKKPNGLGLYDMSGNVWEWCQDWYGSYNSSSATNPQGPSSGSDRVSRGGSWEDCGCRVSDRFANSSDTRANIIGFRVVCER